MSRKKKKMNVNPRKEAERKAAKKERKELRKKKKKIRNIIIAVVSVIAFFVGIYLYFREEPKDMFEDIPQVQIDINSGTTSMDTAE